MSYTTYIQLSTSDCESYERAAAKAQEIITLLENADLDYLLDEVTIEQN